MRTEDGNSTLCLGSGLALGRHYVAKDLAIGPLTWERVTIRKARRTEINIAASDEVFEASMGIAALRQFNLVIDRTNHMAYVRRDPAWNPSQEAQPRRASRKAPAPANSTVRLNFQAHEYADLAQAALESGKFEDAVTNITHLLKLEPDNAGAWAGRGAAFLRLHGAEGCGPTLIARSLISTAHSNWMRGLRPCMKSGPASIT